MSQKSSDTDRNVQGRKAGNERSIGHGGGFRFGNRKFIDNRKDGTYRKDDKEVLSNSYRNSIIDKLNPQGSIGNDSSVSSIEKSFKHSLSLNGDKHRNKPDQKEVMEGNDDLQKTTISLGELEDIRTLYRNNIDSLKTRKQDVDRFLTIASMFPVNEYIRANTTPFIAELCKNPSSFVTIEKVVDDKEGPTKLCIKR